MGLWCVQVNPLLVSFFFQTNILAKLKKEKTKIKKTEDNTLLWEKPKQTNKQKKPQGWRAMFQPSQRKGLWLDVNSC